MVTPKSFVINGTSGVVTLSSITGVKASRWVQLTAPGTVSGTPGSNVNTNNVLVGGAEVTASVGYPLPPGWSGMMFPPIGVDAAAGIYDHTLIRIYVATGDQLQGLYGG